MNFVILSEEDTDEWIKKIELEIAHLAERLSELKKPLDEWYDLFKQAENEYKGVEGLYLKQKSLLESLVRLRTGETGKVRVVRQSSHLDQKLKFDKRIRWSKFITIVLTKHNRLMELPDLFNQILDNQQEFFKTKSLDADARKALWRLFSANITSIKVSGNNGPLRVYNNQVGLAIWFDDKTPKAKYLSFNKK